MWLIAIIVIAAIIAGIVTIARGGGGSSSSASSGTIRSFSASPSFACANDTITLRWDTTGGTPRLSAAPGPGQSVSGALSGVGATGTVDVHISGVGTTVFTLSLGPGVSRTASVQIAGSAGMTATFAPLGTVQCGVFQTITAQTNDPMMPLVFAAAGWQGTLDISATQFSAGLRIRNLRLVPGFDRPIAVNIGGTWFGVNPGVVLNVSSLSPHVVGPWIFWTPLTGSEHCHQDTTTGAPPSTPPALAVVAELGCGG